MAGMRDKHIWIFNGGNDFSGNPKWLFMYIGKISSPTGFATTNGISSMYESWGFMPICINPKKAGASWNVPAFM